MCVFVIPVVLFVCVKNIIVIIIFCINFDNIILQSEKPFSSL